ncbi:MAG: hypothetical protein KGJ02_07705 [Verrucomicrobiota bacterium]|nr:hypothetical protein [Verrucomicrobiota bacterium]
MIGGRFKATKVEPSSAPQINGASRLTGLFQTRVNEVKPTETHKPIKVTLPVEKSPQEPPASDGKS